MEIIHEKIVKTRKPHHCFGCGRKFEKGSNLQSITSAGEGTVTTAYWCETCQEYWSRHMENGDLIGYGELRDEDLEGWEEVRKDVEQLAP